MAARAASHWATTSLTAVSTRVCTAAPSVGPGFCVSNLCWWVRGRVGQRFRPSPLLLAPRSRLSPTPPHFFSLSFAEVKPSPAPARLPAPCRHLPGPSQGVNGVSGHGRLWLGLVRLSFLRLLFIVLGVPAARLLLILPDLSPLRCRLFIIAAAFLSRSEVGSLSVSALHAATTSRLTCLLKCLPGKVVI
jgi:hypothetical protein